MLLLKKKIVLKSLIIISKINLAVTSNYLAVKIVFICVTVISIKTLNFITDYPVYSAEKIARIFSAQVIKKNMSHSKKFGTYIIILAEIKRQV